MDGRTLKRLTFIINTVYMAVIAVLVLVSIKYFIPWTMPFWLAFILVSMMNPLIRWLKKTLGVQREIISLLVILLVYILVCSLLAFLGTQLVFLLRDFFVSLPGYYDSVLQPSLVAAGNTIAHLSQNLPAQFQIQAGDLQDTILNTLQGLLLDISQKGIAGVTAATTRIPAFFIALIFTVMLSFFMSMHYANVTAYFRGLFSPASNKRLNEFQEVMKDTVVRYLRALLTMMVVTFVELSVGLLLLGKPKAVLVALGIALFDALPIVGTGGIMVPWAIIDLLRGNFASALGLGILYAIITVVRNIIEPKIVSDKLGINPVASLTSIYVGFRVMGVWGMILMPILLQMFLALQQRGWFQWRSTDSRQQ